LLTYEVNKYLKINNLSLLIPFAIYIFSKFPLTPVVLVEPPKFSLTPVVLTEIHLYLSAKKRVGQAFVKGGNDAPTLLCYPLLPQSVC